jgi:hypothetical protein
MLITPLQNAIEYFYNINNKCDNDHTNSIRENIILYVLNREKVELDAYMKHDIYGQKWTIFINSLNKVLSNILEEFEKKLENKIYEYDVINIGGRKNNDFTIRIYQNDKKIEEIKLEFKNNSDQIEKLPEICQLYENTEYVSYNSSKKETSSEKVVSYYEYYYHNILPKIRERFPTLLLPEITFESYKKDVQKAGTSKNRDKYPFFKKLDEIRNTNIDYFDRTFVDTSINDWLNIICLDNTCALDIKLLSIKLKQMTSKIFLMWKYDLKNINNSKFYIEKINNTDMDNIKFNSLKGGKNGKNTIILNDCQNEYHCLLRWKNHNGIQGTAWQIKLKKYNTLKN